VVVTVAAVRVVQVAVDEVVDVVTVRDGRVAASGAVNVGGVVGAAGVSRGAGGRIPAADRQGVLFHRAAGLMVEVPVVQVVDMPLMLNGNMTAVRTVFVIMRMVLMAHDESPQRVDGSEFRRITNRPTQQQ
jgi:hypothetical protein